MALWLFSLNLVELVPEMNFRFFTVHDDIWRGVNGEITYAHVFAVCVVLEGRFLFFAQLKCQKRMKFVHKFNQKLSAFMKTGGLSCWCCIVCSDMSEWRQREHDEATNTHSEKDSQNCQVFFIGHFGFPYAIVVQQSQASDSQFQQSVSRQMKQLSCCCECIFLSIFVTPCLWRVDYCCCDYWFQQIFIQNCAAGILITFNITTLTWWAYVN